MRMSLFYIKIVYILCKNVANVGQICPPHPPLGYETLEFGSGGGAGVGVKPSPHCLSRVRTRKFDSLHDNCVNDLTNERETVVI